MSETREEAVEVVEADVLRLRLAVLAEVPLADRLRDVARVDEQLGERDLALQAALLAVHRRPLQAVAHRQPAGHAATRATACTTARSSTT